MKDLRLIDEKITDLLIRILNWQDNFPSTIMGRQWSAMDLKSVERVGYERYKCDNMFRARVMSIVAPVMQVIENPDVDIHGKTPESALEFLMRQESLKPPKFRVEVPTGD